MPQTDVAIAKVWYLLFGVTCWGNLLLLSELLGGLPRTWLNYIARTCT